MADETDVVEVEIKPEDQPQLDLEKDKGGKKEGDPEIITGEEGAAELKRKLDAEVTARQEAETRANQATREAQIARAEIEDSNTREITTAIDVVKRNIEAAKKAYKDARAAGDIDAEAEANDVWMQAKTELLQLEGAKVTREAEKKKPQPNSQDPVEALAATLTPKSAAWVRAHPAFARNQQLYAKMVSASNFVLASGAAPESDEYFQKVEEMLGVTEPVQRQQTNNTDATVETPMSAASRPVAPAAAPVSRGGGGPGATRPGTIRLSREQAEVAEASYPDLVKKEGPAAAHRAYAKSMMELKANGRMQ